MKLLDRLRGSAKKEAKPELPPILGIAGTEDILSSSPDTADLSPRQEEEARFSKNSLTPKSHHAFSWGLRRKRNESDGAATDHHAVATSLVVPNTPQNHEVYLEDDRTTAPTAAPQDALLSPFNLSAPRSLAKTLFVSTIAPIVEPPSPKAASLFASLSSSQSKLAATETTATDDHSETGNDDDEPQWDYEHDIPLYVDEEDYSVIHRILMTQSPRRIKLQTPRNENDENNERNQVSRAVTALDKAGNELFALGRYEDAYLRYERALLLKKRTLEDTHDETVPRAGRSVEELRRSQAQAQNGNKEQKATILASVATSINNITYIKQRTGQATTEETMASYLKSLQIKRDILGPDHLSVGKTLNNIGSVFYLKKEYEPALTAYKDAYRIMEAKLGEDHLDVGTVVSNVGDVYFATGDKEQALEHYTRALDIRWSKLQSRDQKVVRLMQQVAMLETGTQPSMETYAQDAEASDDLEEAEIIREMERHRMSVFIEDVQKLQQEVKDDLKFFDLAERQLEIDLVKDRMRIFREMRELYNASEEFSIEDSLRESMKVIPGLAEQLKRLRNHEYDDVYNEALEDPDATVELQPDSPTIAGKPSAPVTDVATPADQTTDTRPQPLDLTISDSVRTTDAEHPETTLCEPVQTHTDTGHPQTAISELVVLTPDESKESVHQPTETTQPLEVESPASEHQEENELPSSVPGPALMASTVSTPKSSFRGRVLQNAKDREQTNSVKPPPVEGSSAGGKLYSPDRNKAAIEGVRERLERLRRERAQRVTWEEADEQRTDSGKEQPETRRRSYMFPTIASAAKAMTPKKLRRVPGGSLYWNRKGTPKSQPNLHPMAEEDSLREV